MQYCSKETIAWFFYNTSNSLELLFIFFFFTSIFLTKILAFFGGNLFFTRNNEGYEYGTFSDEEFEDENIKDNNVESMQEDQHVGTIFCESEKLDFSNTEITDQEEEEKEEEEEEDEISTFSNDDNEDVDENYINLEKNSYNTSSAFESIPTSDEEVVTEEILARDLDSCYDCDRNDFSIPTSTRIFNNNKNHIPMRNGVGVSNGIGEDSRVIEKEKKVGTFTREDNFVGVSNLEKKKIEMAEKEDEEDIFGDSCTVGSTSKSSSEWRSSINNRDYATDDPFSSSSRRSCLKWESYTVFQKYDEEMLFLDRITAQKLHETESLRSIQACPRSISERIVHKFVNPKSSSNLNQNPYQELECAYVAQICWTWEALNWNYKYFQTLTGARREQDPGCPAYVAQQFQQFLVLLQRYVENEPYEHGRRPEIYARMRRLAPKLLQVPEYRDCDEEKREEGYGSRIPSNSFVLIMEEAIRTFMDFLKADKKTRCQILADIFKRKPRLSVDPNLLFLLNKDNKKKQKKLKEVRRSSCLGKRKLKLGQEIEILMALIDLKVISRVLRMKGLNEGQMQWCQAKMSNVKVSNGKLQRDSSPLFFPAHY